MLKLCFRPSFVSASRTVPVRARETTRVFTSPSQRRLSFRRKYSQDAAKQHAHDKDAAILGSTLRDRLTIIGIFLKDIDSTTDWKTMQAQIDTLKSGLEVEVSWALNTLLVLSSGSGVRYDAFHVGLAHCGDLLEELVGLLERSALVEGEEKSAGLGQPSFDIEGKSTHADWVAKSLEAEEEANV